MTKKVLFLALGFSFIYLVRVRYLSDVLWEVDIGREFEGPSFERPLGSDRLGRDLFQRILYALGSYIFPATFASLISVGLGGIIGGLAGYRSIYLHTGFLCLSFIFRFLLIVPLSIPKLVLIFLFCGLLGFDLLVISIVTGSLCAAEFGEELRILASRYSLEEFVVSAQLEGIHNMHILLVHIFYYHAKYIFLGYVSEIWSLIILVECSLSFIPGQYGVQEPEPSLGNMLVGAATSFERGHYFPAIVISSVVIGIIGGFSILSDVLESYGRGSRFQFVDIFDFVHPRDMRRMGDEF